MPFHQLHRLRTLDRKGRKAEIRVTILSLRLMGTSEQEVLSNFRKSNMDGSCAQKRADIRGSGIRPSVSIFRSDHSMISVCSPAALVTLYQGTWHLLSTKLKNIFRQKKVAPPFHRVKEDVYLSTTKQIDCTTSESSGPDGLVEHTSPN